MPLENAPEENKIFYRREPVKNGNSEPQQAGKLPKIVVGGVDPPKPAHEAIVIPSNNGPASNTRCKNCYQKCCKPIHVAFLICFGLLALTVLLYIFAKSF